MLDLNALRVFEQVATLRSFVGAARSLGMPRTNVSRAISRLEAELSTRLLHRSTRDVTLTPAGEALYERCREILGSLDEAVDYLGSLGVAPRGKLRITAGVGFGINVLGRILAEFVELYPDVDVTLDLTSRQEDLIAKSVDPARPDAGLCPRHHEARVHAALFVRIARAVGTPPCPGDD
jgi:LysR family transcriptional regulator, regulator for bpeEF and oprC